MVADDGEVLQGLNDTWTFMGANLFEWVSGFMVFLLVSLFFKSPARAMPYMLGACIATTAGLAGARKSFPDEERGLRNALAVSCGIVPPGLPPPASLQPVWSQCPVRDLPKECAFNRLGLNEMFPDLNRELTDVGTGEEVKRG